jgi:predicted alpha/beta hydrolase
MRQARADPLFFGPSKRPLFGFLHSQAASSGLGLVIANPFGYEAVCAHRSLRHFAEAAAKVGVPALRFDYDGTGDSAGDDRDPDRLAAWVASVGHAIDALRSRTSVSRVCVLGVRLGALVAALASATRDDVAGLVAVAPVIAGKAYLRELRALQMALGLSEPPAGSPAAEGSQEALGFFISADTKAAITKVDLTREERPPAPHVLLLDRGDMPANEAWGKRLGELGAKVDARRMPGYVEMVLDPHKAVVPEEMVSATAAWLYERAKDVPASGERADLAASATAATSREAHVSDVRDRAVHVDEARGLFGILSTPKADGRTSKKGIVLLNAGSVHHIGPNRLYVPFARRWAAQGHVVLRMDIAGIGDSFPLAGEDENIVYAARATDDVRAAADYLRREHGIRDCISVGLCSGAYHGFKAAVAGARLDRVVLINPLTFQWRPGMSLDQPGRHSVIAEAERYSESALSLEKWKKVLRGDVDLRNVARTMGRHAMGRAVELTRDGARRVGRPFADDVGAELEAVASHGTQLRFLFAAGDPGLPLLKGQAGSSLGKLLGRRALTIDVVDGPDHTFTALWTHEPLRDALDALIEE